MLYRSILFLNFNQFAKKKSNVYIKDYGTTHNWCTLRNIIKLGEGNKNVAECYRVSSSVDYKWFLDCQKFINAKDSIKQRHNLKHRQTIKPQKQIDLHPSLKLQRLHLQA